MDYTPELGQKICAEMVTPKSLAKICKQPGMPTKRVVMSWLQKYPEFLEIYRIAQKERAEVYFEECVDIADDGSQDFVEDADGHVRVDKEHINRSRLRVDTRKWICAKMDPKKYGDKVDLTHANPDGTPLAVEFHIVDHRPKTEG
jgi:hypothetical protein